MKNVPSESPELQLYLTKNPLYTGQSSQEEYLFIPRFNLSHIPHDKKRDMGYMGDGKHYYLLCDLSTSMTGERLLTLKSFLYSFIENMPQSDTFSIIGFSGQATDVLGRICAANNSQDRQYALDKIKKMAVIGRTVFATAFEQVKKLQGSRAISVVFLTDGCDNALDNIPENKKRDASRKIYEHILNILNREFDGNLPTIVPIGIGNQSELDQNFLLYLAEKTNLFLKHALNDKNEPCLMCPSHLSGQCIKPFVQEIFQSYLPDKSLPVSITISDQAPIHLGSLPVSQPVFLDQLKGIFSEQLKQLKITLDIGEQRIVFADFPNPGVFLDCAVMQIQYILEQLDIFYNTVCDTILNEPTKKNWTFKIEATTRTDGQANQKITKKATRDWDKAESVLKENLTKKDVKALLDALEALCKWKTLDPQFKIAVEKYEDIRQVLKSILKILRNDNPNTVEQCANQATKGHEKLQQTSRILDFSVSFNLECSIISGKGTKQSFFHSNLSIKNLKTDKPASWVKTSIQNLYTQHDPNNPVLFQEPLKMQIMQALLKNVLPEFFDELKKTDCSKNFILQAVLLDVFLEWKKELKKELKQATNTEYTKILDAIQILMTLGNPGADSQSISCAELLWYLSAQYLFRGFSKEKSIFLEKTFFEIFEELCEGMILNDPTYVSRLPITACGVSMTLRAFCTDMTQASQAQQEDLCQAVIGWSQNPHYDSFNLEFYINWMESLANRTDLPQDKKCTFLNYLLFCLETINNHLYQQVTQSKAYQTVQTVQNKHNSFIKNHETPKKINSLNLTTLPRDILFHPDRDQSKSDESRSDPPDPLTLTISKKIKKLYFYQKNNADGLNLKLRKTIVHFLSDSVQNSVQVDPLSEFFDALKKEDCTRGFVLQKPLQKVLNELDDLLKDKKKKKNKLIIAVKNSLMTLRKTEKNDKNTYAELLWYLSAQNLFDEQNNVFIQYNKNFLHIIGGLFEASIDDDSRHISRMCILEKEQTTLREFYDTIKTDRTNDRETLFEALAVWSLDPELGLNEKFYTQSIRIVQRVETISRQHHQLLHCFLLCLKNINPDLYKTVKKSKEYKKYKLDEKNQSNIEKHQPSKQKSVLGDPNQTQIHSIRKNSGCQSFFLNKLPKNSSSESSEEEKKQNVNKKY